MKHLNIKIYGLVQEVFFRVNAKEDAEKLGIKGFARNEEDGTVYIEAEGNEKDLDKFLDWCKNGPENAKVEKIETTNSSMKNFSGFGRNLADY